MYTNSNASHGHELVTTTEYGYFVLLLLPVVTICGNLLVILAVASDLQLKKSITNRYISSLAFCDLLVGVIVMPLAVYVKANNGEWELGTVLCKFYVACDVSASTASILHLVVISCDRYFAVMHPMEYQRYSHGAKTSFAVVLIWLVSATLTIPVLMGKSTINTEHCWLENPEFMLYSSFLSFYIPAFVLTMMYVKLFKKIRKRKGIRDALRAYPCSASTVPFGLPMPIVKESYMENGGPGEQETAAGVGANNAKHGLLKRSYSHSHVIRSSFENLSKHRLNNNNNLLTYRFDTVDEMCSGEISCSPSVHRSRSCLEDMRKGGDTSSPDEGDAAYVAKLSVSSTDSAPQFESQLRKHFASAKSNYCDGTKGSHCDSPKSNLDDNPKLNHCDSPKPSNFNLRKYYSPKSSRCASQYKQKHSDCSLIGGMDSSHVSNSASMYSSKKDFRYESESSCLDFDPNGVASTATNDQSANRRRTVPDEGNNGSAFKRMVRSVAKTVRRLRETNALRKECKATKLVAIVLAVFIFCWVPFFTFNILRGICLSLVEDALQCDWIPPEVFFLTSWLGYANSSVNPLLYACVNDQFRNTYRKILHIPKCPPKTNSTKYLITPTNSQNRKQINT